MRLFSFGKLFIYSLATSEVRPPIDYVIDSINLIGHTQGEQ